MAVTYQGKSIVMTADADAATGLYFINGMTYQGTSLTAGQRLRVTATDGTVLADYQVEAATDNADLWAGKATVFVKGILVEDFPASGGTLTISFE